MSYINKPGKTSSWRQMVIRQQVSDVFSYGSIKTTFVKAKETQRHVDRLITLAKKGTLDAKRRILSVVLKTPKANKDDILKKILETAKKYATRKGGYSRVLRITKRQGDNTQTAILELV